MSTAAILAHLAKGPATAASIEKALRLTPGAVRGALSKLESERSVKSQFTHTKGPQVRTYSITGEGRGKLGRASTAISRPTAYW